MHDLRGCWLKGAEIWFLLQCSCNRSLASWCIWHPNMSSVALQGYSKHKGLTKNHSFRTMSFIARHAPSNSTLLTCLCLCDSLKTRSACSSEPLVLVRPAAGLFPPRSIRTNRCAFGKKGFVICAETRLGLCSSQPAEEVPLGNNASLCCQTHPTCSKSGDTPFHLHDALIESDLFQLGVRLLIFSTSKVAFSSVNECGARQALGEDTDPTEGRRMEK